MEHITAIIVALIAGLASSIPACITAISSLKKSRAAQSDVLDEKLKPIISDIQELKYTTKKSRIDMLKNFLVKCLDEMEMQRSPLGASTMERFYESLDEYTNELHQNSYIHKRVHDLEEAKII